MDRSHPAPALPSIPVPKNDVDSLYATTMAMKQIVEQMSGRQAATMNAPADTATSREYKPTMFVQDQPPMHSKAGDFWLVGDVLNVSVNGTWKVV